MRSTSRAVLIAAIVSTAFLGSTPPTAQADAIPRLGTDVVQMTGFLLDPAGFPVPGGEVEFRTLRQTRTGAVTGLVDSTVTDDDGAFTVQMPLAGAPRDSAGGIVGEIVYRAPAHAPGLVYDVRFTPDEDGQWDLVAPVDAVARAVGRTVSTTQFYLQLGEGVVTDARRLRGTVPRPTAAVDTVGRVVANGTAADPSAYTGTVRVDGSAQPELKPLHTARRKGSADCPERDYGCFPDQTSCDSGDSLGYEFLPDARKRRTFVPTKFTDGPKNGHLTWTWDRTNETTLGVATKVGDDKYVGADFGASHEQDDGLNKSYTTKHGQKRVIYEMWEYRKQQGICFGDGGRLYYIGVWKYVPYQVDPSAQSRTEKTSITFRCERENRAVFGVTTQVTKRSTMRFSAAFSMWGVHLSDAQYTNSHEESLTIAPDPGKNTVLCGYAATPVSAEAVRAMS
ncbi:hypothetical protein GCM10022215_27260 [Nocardioides fonticola]|uniref:Carboxypeptidase regulatory-like domain-containing protein n=1 Tax=Nocardioides fonticola TaxID=450363 RepID=A0ABP7XM25_9ACTN